MSILRRRPGRTAGRFRAAPKPLSVLAIVIAGAVVVLTTLLALALLVWPRPLITPQTPNDQFDALRTALLIGGATAGAVTLLFAVRRQVYNEYVSRENLADAEERRVTEMYMNAVEELESEKAPVRLGGMYALERLANHNPGHRQTVVDVICSYLRMPFEFEPDPSISKLPPATAIFDWYDPVRVAPDYRQELEVRAAAQDILVRHLQGSTPQDRYADTQNWGLRSLNLRGATLVEFNAQCMRIGAASFEFATFNGVTMFNDTQFTEFAGFTGATFDGPLLCESTEFTEGASFMGAVFRRPAYFRGAKFGGHAVRFRGARFEGETYFHRTSFAPPADFNGAEFHGPTTFTEARFDGTGAFQPFKLAEDPFENGTSSGSAEFVNTQFLSHLTFNDVHLGGEASFQGTAFWSAAAFRGCNHYPSLILEGAHVRLDVPEDVENSRQWPVGSTLASTQTPPGLPTAANWGTFLPNEYF